MRKGGGTSCYLIVAVAKMLGKHCVGSYGVAGVWGGKRTTNGSTWAIAYTPTRAETARNSAFVRKGAVVGRTAHVQSNNNAWKALCWLIWCSWCVGWQKNHQLKHLGDCVYAHAC